MTVDDGAKMIEPFDRDPPRDVGDWAAQDEKALDHHESQVLERPAGEPAPGRRRRGGKRQREIRQRQTAAASEDRVADVTEPSPEPICPSDGKRRDRRGEQSKDYAVPRRRSRNTSIAIGTSDSTITITTTTWMWRLMSGMTCPNRYPAHVMLTTHPTPPTTL